MDRKALTLLFIALLISSYFRLANLGYSEFQNDEVDVLLHLNRNQSFLDFLLEQKKGPGQFVVGYLAQQLSTFENMELITRLPFALFGILAVLLVFFVASRIFGSQVGVVSAAIIGMSGLMIALSKLLQFPAFIMAASCLCVLITIHLSKSPKGELLLASTNGAVAGLAFLFHYDALAFIIPIFAYLVFSRKLKCASTFAATATFVSILFYLPYVLNPSFKNTYDFLVNTRIGSDVNASFSKTINVLFLYHSKEFLGAIAFGLLLWIISVTRRLGIGVLVLIVFSVGALAIRLYKLDDIIYGGGVILWVLLLFAYMFFSARKGQLSAMNLIEFWFLFAFASYFVVIKFPLTHIFNVFIPMLILVSNECAKLAGKFWPAPVAVLAIVLVSTLSFNYFAFIDTKEEYPWELKGYIFGWMNSETAYKRSTQGVFGLPYRRGWKEISAKLQALSPEYGIKSFNTNEKPSIARFYLNYGRKNVSFNVTNYDVFIKIHKPYTMVSPINLKGRKIASGDRYDIILINKAAK